MKVVGILLSLFLLGGPSTEDLKMLNLGLARALEVLKIWRDISQGLSDFCYRLMGSCSAMNAPLCRSRAGSKPSL